VLGKTRSLSKTGGINLHPHHDDKEGKSKKGRMIGGLHDRSWDSASKTLSREEKNLREGGEGGRNWEGNSLLRISC